MKKILVWAIPIIMIGLPAIALGQQATTFSLESVDIGLGDADLKETTLNVLRWVLGIMALVAVTMIIFAGFIAATSSDQDRAGTARRVIVGAVIGLIVILLAWAIVIFVADTTANVTQV